MKKANQKQPILSLIEDDLRNARLIHGLNKLGLYTEEHFLHLSQTVFRLMGFPESQASDAAYDRYHKLSRKAVRVPPENSLGLKLLAVEIYTELKMCRKV